MTAAWLPAETAPGFGPAAPRLRLVADGGATGAVGRTHRVPVEARRRRTLLAVMGLLLVGLALPLAGTGGHSHATGSAPAGTGVAGVYTVQPGDTLWAIAQRADPTADPRPLVARLAQQVGSDRVVPGEHLVVP